MDMEGALRARIVALGTAAADRVYWMDRPQGTSLPSITLQMISGDREYTSDGLQATRDPRIQLDAWGASYGQAKGIVDAIISGLSVSETNDGIAFEPARFENERDGLERLETTNVYRRGIDLIVWHHPA
jgi:hypothetical protein